MVAVGASAGVPADGRVFTLTTATSAHSLQVWRQDDRWWAIGDLHQGPVEITPGLAKIIAQSSEAWGLGEPTD